VNGGVIVMRAAKIILCVFGILGVCAPAQRVTSNMPTQNKRIVIAASAVFDGKGHILRDTRIVVEGGKIVAIERLITTCAG
jgi:hypothetical protein